jgi:hypothetical protein
MRPRAADRRDVAAVGPAAAAEHPQLRQLRLQRPVFGRQLLRVAVVEVLSFVEFGVAEA